MNSMCSHFFDGAAVRFPNRLVAVLLSSVLLFGAPMVSIEDNGTTDGVQTAGSESPVPGVPGNAGACSLLATRSVPSLTSTILARLISKSSLFANPTWEAVCFVHIALALSFAWGRC